MKSIKGHIILFILEFLISILILGATYSQAVTTNVNTKSELEFAISSSNPGDEIIIENGTYTNFGQITILHTKDCTQAQPCIIRAESVNGAVFNGQGALTFDIRSRWWRIEDIKWQNQTNFGNYSIPSASSTGPLIVFDGAQDSIVDNVTIQNISGTGVVIAFMRHLGIRDAQRNTLQNSTINGYTQTNSGAVAIYNLGRSERGYNNINNKIINNTFINRSTSASQGSQYWIRYGNSNESSYNGGSNISDPPRNSGFLIQGNIFKDDILNASGHDTMHLKVSGATVNSNTFENVARVGFRNGRDNKLINNMFIRPNTSKGDHSAYIADVNQIVANNVWYSVSSKTAIEIAEGNTDVNSDNKLDYKAFSGQILHNTFYGFKDESIQADETSDGKGGDGLTTVQPTITLFRNNVSYQTIGIMIKGSNCATLFTTADHNAWSGGATESCITQSGAGDVTSAPQFNNPAGGDLSLKSTSPLIDAGATISGVAETNLDVRGAQRDSNPDIGAYEFGATPPASDTCDSIFGGATDYLLCNETSSSCKFNVTLSGGDCDTLCTSFGKTCIGAFDNNAGSCIELSADTCSTTRQDEICVCEKQGDPPDPPGSPTIWYIDSSCVTNGNGSSTTCGANGPWNSIKYAMQTADCAGMSPGDILEIRGMTATPAAGNWYDDIFYAEAPTRPDSNCSNMRIRQYSGATEHVVVDGTVDRSGSTWTSIGSGVYECVGCGDPTSENLIPHRAWYQIGAGAEQELDLIHTVRTCSSSLASGKMTYNPISNSVCAHLNGGGSPQGITYFRIPFRLASLRLQFEDIDGLTIEDGGAGSIRFVRFARNVIEMDPSVNQNITIDGIVFSDILETAIKSFGGQGIANYTFIDNTFNLIGETAIWWEGDLGVSSIVNNTFSNIGVSPNFEDCDGTGAGCHGGYDWPPTGVLVNNCAPIDDVTKATIDGNIGHDFGNGYGGAIASGIHLKDCTHANWIDSNHFYDSTALAGFNAIYMSGIPSGQYHDHNRIINTRCEEVDRCLLIKYDTATDQTGRDNFIYGNSCYNPTAQCWKQDVNGANVGGKLWFRNNLAVSDDGQSDTLLDVPSSTSWQSSAFTNNGFECSHIGSCSDSDLVIFQGSIYKRTADCTAGVNCIEDINAFGNIYGSMDISATSLDIGNSSAAIDAGKDLSFLPHDRYKTIRPFGAFSDIGAHENTGGSLIFDLTQQSFIFCQRKDVDCSEPISAENGTVRLYDKSQFIIRFAVSADTGVSSHLAELTPYYQFNGGSWNAIPNTCVGQPICLVDDPNREDGEAITNKLSLGSRTFLETSAYYDTLEDGIETIIASNQQVEIEFYLGFCEADGTCGIADFGDAYNLRMQHTGGALLNTYNKTASLTLGTIRGFVLQSQ